MKSQLSNNSVILKKCLKHFNAFRFYTILHNKGNPKTIKRFEQVRHNG